MRTLSRRSLFALPLAVPMALSAAALAVAAMPAKRLPAVQPLRRLGQRVSFPELKPALLDEARWDKIAADISKEIAAEIARLEPSARDLAATLGVPHEEPLDWTDEEVALTIGIDVQRDGIVIGAMVRT